MLLYCWNCKDWWGQCWNIHSVRVESTGEIILVAQYDLPKLQQCAALPYVLCSVVSAFVSGGVYSLFLTGLEREKKRGHPYSLIPSRRLSTLGLYKVWHTKEKEECGVGVGLLLQPKVKHGTDYQTHYWGKYLYFRAFSALVPFNLCAENVWNFINNWASQSGYVISYATDVYQCPAIGKIAIYDV